MGAKRTALVTDSTWSLPTALARQLRLAVVPLHVSFGSRTLCDCESEVPHITEALRTRAATTSQPTPGEIAAVLEEVATGADRVVAIHLSGALSGTCAAVGNAAAALTASTGVRIDVVDSRTVGGALGYAVAVAAYALATGVDADGAIARARECAATSRVFLTVSDLRHLQRGGRVRAPQAAVGTALGIKPILHLQSGEIRVLESVRGTRKAHQQLVSRALVAAGAPTRGPREPRSPVSFAVHHVGEAEEAESLAARLREAAAEADLAIDRLDVTPMSGVLAAHAGPGALAIAVARTRGLIHTSP